MPHKRSRDCKASARRAYRNKKKLKRSEGSINEGLSRETFESGPWRRYWDLALKCWREEKEKVKAAYIDGSGVPEVTSPLSNSCDIDGWRAQPLVKCILETEVVKEAIEKLKLGTSPQDIENIFHKDGSGIISKITTVCERFFNVNRNKNDEAKFNSKFELTDHC